MRRGTTPTIDISTDIDLSHAEVVYLTFSQGGTVVLEKELQDLTIDSRTISCVLSQADTLKFSTGDKMLRCQIRARLSDGTALASNVFSIGVKEILKDGEI